MEQVCSSTLCLTSVLDGVGGQITLRLLYPQERHSVPIVQEAGWATRPVWTRAENLTPNESDPLTVQDVAGRHTD